MYADPSDSAAAAPPDAQRRLRIYADLLATWTRRINLVSRADVPLIWTRHVQDSLRLIPLIPADADCGIDLGSGGGLPGLVLAIATGLPFDLVESDRRKAVFLEEARRATGAPVRIHCARIEAVDLPPSPLVTARALAPLDVLLGLAAPFLAPGGTGLFPKGARAAAEVAAAQARWRMRLQQAGPADAPILVVTDLAPAEAAHG